MILGPEIISEVGAMTRCLSSTFDVKFAFESTDDKPFEATISSFSLGRSLKLAQIAFSPHRTRRVSHGAQAAPSHYLVNQLVSGQLVVYQDGREAEINAGDIYLINPSRDFSLETGSVVTNSLYVNATAFRVAYPEVDCCSAIPLRRDAQTTVMVSDLIDNLFRHGDSFSNGVRDKCGDAFPHVLAIALAANIDELASCPSKMSLFHKERIKAFVRDNLGDHQLSCKMIADALKLSDRYIFDIFSDEPLTLMRWIRTERLARCRRELSSPTLRNRSVSEIAYAWGFVDIAHFSRVFCTEFGQSPRAYRRGQIGEQQRLN